MKSQLFFSAVKAFAMLVGITILMHGSGSLHARSFEDWAFLIGLCMFPLTGVVYVVDRTLDAIFPDDKPKPGPQPETPPNQPTN